MEVDIEAFLGNPTAEQLDKFKKKRSFTAGGCFKHFSGTECKKTKD